MSKTINKGRTHYRRLQAKCKAKCSRIRIPSPGEDGYLYLSDRRYEAKNIRNKVFEATSETGRLVKIPYTTCTYVRA